MTRLSSALLLLSVAAALAASGSRVGAATTTAAATTTTTHATAARAPDGVKVELTKIDTGATLVTAKLKPLPPSELYFRLGQLSAVGILPDDGSLWAHASLQNALIEAEWDAQPLWAVLEELREATGLNAETRQDDSAPPHIRLSRRPQLAPAHVAGPALLRALRVTRTDAVSYADNSRDPGSVGQMRVELNLKLEPKLRRFATVGQPAVQEASDDAGRSLVPPAPATRPTEEVAPPRRSTTYGGALHVMLAYPPEVGKRIAVVRGAIPLEVVRERALVTFELPLKPGAAPLTADLGTTRLTLKEVRGGARAGHQVFLSLARGADLTDSQWQAANQAFNHADGRVMLVGPKGESDRNGHSGDQGDTEANADIRYSPRKDWDEPSAVVVEVPVRFETIEAKFEFKDLPVP